MNDNNNDIKSKIVAVLRRYCAWNDNGEPNPEFDNTFTAEAALDEVHSIVGEI